ncbi:hypothetical protein Hanom_Chr04g00280231 [Helianthus anomalus]
MDNKHICISDWIGWMGIYGWLVGWFVGRGSCCICKMREGKREVCK